MIPFKGRISALLVDSHLISSALLTETWKIDLIHKIFKSFTHPPPRLEFTQSQASLLIFAFRDTTSEESEQQTHQSLYHCYH